MSSKPLNIDKVFRPIFETIPQYHLSTGNISNKLLYHLGDQSELDEVLRVRQLNRVKAYPLLWYNMPNSFRENDQYANGMFEFVFAMNSDLDELNDQRFDFSYSDIIYPNFDLFIQALRGAGNVELNKLSNGSKMYWERTEYPNYGSNSKESNDVWDALKVKVNLTIIKSNCQGEIKYNIKNLL